MFEQFMGTSPVQERHRFDGGTLAAYLRDHVHEDGADFNGPLIVEQFKGGQSNPTFLLRTAARRYVLRRKPPGPLLPSAHAIEREYRVMNALRASAVPVPRVVCLCEDTSVIGSAFYVMEHMQGRILWDPALPGFRPDERARLFDDMNRVIAALHRVDVAAAGLADYGKPGNYFARQIGRWSAQYRASETERIEAMDRLIEWLPQHIPPGDATALVHGDYRLDNLVFHPSEPRVVAVLDWELSTLGHPLADFSYHCMSWHIPPGSFRGLGGVDIAALGIPDEKTYVRRYCERTGRPDPDAVMRDWNFYLAYNMFRLAGILQGIAKRVEMGTASSAQARQAGAGARPLAEMGWAIAQKA
jgi:aminoglycoside phosphotransferase (APT) family kinase protein